MRRLHTFALLAFAALAPPASAGDVEIVHAKFQRTGNGEWYVSVTLRHDDQGWDHYADAWRVVDGSERVLGTRTLFHPHENEQPFTRGLGGVAIEPSTTRVFVEAHDKVHGWSGQRLSVDLREARGSRFEVTP